MCVALKDTKAHEEALRNLFAQYEKIQLKQIHEEFASRYNRLVLTGELARQFESLMDLDKNALVNHQEEVA